MKKMHIRINVLLQNKTFRLDMISFSLSCEEAQDKND